MSAGKELYEVDAWIRATLAGGTALCALVGGTASPRIYSGLAPQNTSFPFVLFDVQEARDETGVAGDRGCVTTDYLVRAVTQEPSFSGGAAIMAQVDPLLHQQIGTVLSGTAVALNVIGCVRLQPIRYIETDEGVRYNHVGAMYRIWAANP